MSANSQTQLTFPTELIENLATSYQSGFDLIKKAAILELYREGKLSPAKAGERLDMERFEFIRYAGMKGIPYLRMSADEIFDEAEEIGKFV